MPQARHFLRVAEKLDVPCAVSSIRTFALAFASNVSNLLRKWLYARIFNDDQLRLTAMRAFIAENTPITPFDELDQVTSQDLADLCIARERAQNEARIALSKVTWNRSYCMSESRPTYIFGWKCVL